MKMTLKAKLMTGQTGLLPEAMESLNKMCDRVSEKAFFAKGSNSDKVDRNRVLKQTGLTCSGGHSS